MTPTERVSALARRLVAIRSASPDPVAERACARALADALPSGLERGEWLTADGRPVVWALLRGDSPRTVILLGHYDTVGFKDYAAIGAEAIACDPAALAPVLARRARAGDVGPGSTLLDDLDEERRHPGTWMFGRGALDMKSGLAAGIAALEELSDARPSGGVLWVATPDEEHLSEGMKTATPRIAQLAAEERLDLVGAINLDYCLEPALYAGVGGKMQLGCYVLGEAGHVADPGRGMNALEVAARVVAALAPDGGAPHDATDLALDAPPAALKLDDLKSGYSIEPPTEALVEFSVPFHETTLEETLSRCRNRIARALGGGVAERVLLLPELTERAAAGGVGHEGTGASPRAASDARTATLDRLRALCRACALRAPAVVLHLLPPFYPPSAAAGRFSETATAWASGQGIAVRGRYPFISDASYLAWRGVRAEGVARHLLALGNEYTLPIDEAAALDLDVVNLGPWGRDAHRLYERVHAPYAFGRLPGLIASLAREVLR